MIKFKDLIELMPFHSVEKLQSTRGAARSYNDCDYWSDLKSEEQAWLVKFLSEYYHCEVSKLKPIHKKAYQLDLYKADNCRRRDLSNYKTGETVLTAPNYSTPSPEDTIIEAIDLCRKRKK